MPAPTGYATRYPPSNTHTRNPRQNGPSACLTRFQRTRLRRCYNGRVITDLTARFPIPRAWPRQTSRPADIDTNAIHHTATLYLSHTATVADEINQIAVIHQYHIGRGFAGFGYHGIAFPSSRAYIVTPFDQWGANVAEENDHVHGYAAAGTYTTTPPPPALHTGLARLVAAGRRYLGRTVPDRPHRHWGGTTCPGEPWATWVPALTILASKEDDTMTPQQQKELAAATAAVTALRRRAAYDAHIGVLLQYAGQLTALGSTDPRPVLAALKKRIATFDAALASGAAHA